MSAESKYNVNTVHNPVFLKDRIEFYFRVISSFMSNIKSKHHVANMVTKGRGLKPCVN